MPYKKSELTYMLQLKRYRKLYKSKRYYLKAPVKGRSDRTGYNTALKEWQRLKAYLDGFGPSPYTPAGSLIPEEIFVNYGGLIPSPSPPQAIVSPDPVIKEISSRVHEWSITDLIDKYTREWQT